VVKLILLNEDVYKTQLNNDKFTPCFFLLTLYFLFVVNVQLFDHFNSALYGLPAGNAP